MRHTGLTSKRSSQEQARALEGKEGIEERGAERQAAVQPSRKSEYNGVITLADVAIFLTRWIERTDRMMRADRHGARWC